MRLNEGGRLAGAIEPVAQAQNRVPPQHARPRVTHHGFDLFAPRRLIAMDRALHADGLLRPEPAPLQSEGSIIQKPLTLPARGLPGVVMALAVTANHRGNRLEFASQALVGKASAASLAFFRPWPRASRFDGLHISHRQRYHCPEAGEPP